MVCKKQPAKWSDSGEEMACKRAVRKEAKQAGCKTTPRSTKIAFLLLSAHSLIRVFYFIFFFFFLHCLLSSLLATIFPTALSLLFLFISIFIYLFFFSTKHLRFTARLWVMRHTGRRLVSSLYRKEK